METIKAMLLKEIEIFYHVARLGSFSRAAEHLGASKSFISKQITKLEAALKIKLFERSTRHLHLTEAGEAIFQKSESVVMTSDHIFNIVQSIKGAVAGNLKISIPPALGLSRFSNFIADFLKKYPELEVDIRLESRVVDIIKESYDLVLRSGKLEDSNLISKKLVEIRYAFVATQTYLKNHPPLKTAADLHKHTLITYEKTKSIALGDEILHLNSHYTSNSLSFAKKLIESDLAVGLLPYFMAQEAIQNQMFVHCLPNISTAKSSLYAVYPSREFLPAKVSVFLSELKHYFEANGSCF